MLILSFLWMLLLLVATLFLIWHRPVWFPPKYGVWIVLGVAVLARMVPNFLLAKTSNFDIQSFQRAGEVLLQGQDVYTHESTSNRHPYLPLQMYALIGALKISSHFGWPFPFTVRLFPLLVDAALAAFLYWRLHWKIPEVDAFRWGLVYALNPVTIFVSAMHGQFDTLPVALTLMALLWVSSSAWKAGLLLGFAILDKSWPVLAWPQMMVHFRSWRQRGVATLLTGIVPLLAVGIYAWIFHTAPLVSLHKAISYNWGIGIWGYSYFLRMFSMYLSNGAQMWNWFLDISRYLTLCILGWIWFVWARHQSPVRGFLTILLGFIAWGHAFSIQYLLWPVAFAVYLCERTWLARYILAASVYMFLTYYTLIFQNTITRLLPWPQADWFIIMPAGIPVWLVTVFWLWSALDAPKDVDKVKIATAP